MKIPKHPRTLLLFLALTVLLVPVLSAQTTNANSAMNSTNNPPPMGQRGGPMANLTDAERTQLKAAHDKAISQDPTLEQKMKAAHDAMDDARKAMHDALIKADPSIQPILDKMGPKRGGEGHEPHPDSQNKGGTNSTTLPNAVSTNAPSAQDQGGQGRQGRGEGRGMPPGFAGLTPDEQAQLKAVREKIKDDPTVTAARDAAKNATTPDARQTARDAVRQAIHDAMIKADPSIAPLLEKLAPPPGGGAPGQQPGGQGAPMPPPQ